ncbi:MAG: DoxX family protein [Polyangia bacterium]
MTTTNLAIPSGTFATRRDVGLLLIRAALAGPFLYHGAQKLFGWFGGSGPSGFAAYLEGLHIPLPLLSAVLAGASEFLGGVLLLSGRGWPALVPLVFTMAVAILASAGRGYDVQHGGVEYPLALFLLLVAVSLLGAGSLRAPLPGAPRANTEGES